MLREVRSGSPHLIQHSPVIQVRLLARTLMQKGETVRQTLLILTHREGPVSVMAKATLRVTLVLLTIL